MLQARSFRLLAAAITIAGAVIPFTAASGQKPTDQQKAAKKAEQKAEKENKAMDPGKFFLTEEPLTVTLTTNIKRIRGDHGDKTPWRPATISYTDSTGKVVVVPTELKTRGIWRLKNCDFPPVRMNFKRPLTKGTLFHGLDQPKLTSFCRDDDNYEQYVIQELELYRIYHLLTPKSHTARLLQMTYTDSASGKVFAKRAAILLEEPQFMAVRIGGPLMKVKGARSADLEPFHNALVGVFEYLIGNTDFSIGGLHNIELVTDSTGNVFPIPFDFDFSGAINTRYATTDPSLSIQRVRERLYRGYCGPADEVAKVVALFKEKKDAIYALYKDDIGKMLKPKLVDETLEYFDDFYKTINDPRQVRREITDQCLGQ